VWAGHAERPVHTRDAFVVAFRGAGCVAVLAIVAIVFGLILVSQPLADMLAPSMVAGLVALVSGVIGVVMS